VILPHWQNKNKANSFMRYSGTNAAHKTPVAKIVSDNLGVIFALQKTGLCRAGLSAVDPSVEFYLR
jgi:hypothetical protein